MNFNETLRTAIQAVIKTPADPKITGATLQQKLLSILDALDSGGLWMGHASPSTVPNDVAKCFYLATEQGTYTNFLKANGQPITIAKNESALLSSYITNNTIRWTKSSIVTPENNGYITYNEPQQLLPSQRAQALENIGAAVADGENPKLVAGDIIPKSDNPIETYQEFNIIPTGGDVDIKTGVSLLQAIRGNLNSKMVPFMADIWVSTGMNLVNPEQTLTINGRTAYYFPVAKGTWGSYGTTQENNGYIVVGNTPYAVYFSQKAPSVLDYGTVLTPVNYNGRNYYTTPDYGWLVVIVNDNNDMPAVHLAWSNYNDDIGGVFSNNIKRIAAFVQWIHAWGMAALFGSEYASFDEINISEQNCYRRVDRVALNSAQWEMTIEVPTEGAAERDPYIYVFTTTIPTMKSGGLYRHNFPGLEVEGNKLTYRSTEITSVPDFVVAFGSAMIYFELATPVTATFSEIGVTLTAEDMSNDFGLNYFLYNGEIVEVKAFVKQDFQQGSKDQLFNAVTYQKTLSEVCASALCEHEQRIQNLEKQENIECVNLTVKRRAFITGWREVDSAPTSATDPGLPGDYYVGAEYLYICVSNNTWMRSQLSTF